MSGALDHGEHCDADLRRDGCVCAELAERDAQEARLRELAAERDEQEARLRELAAEWADNIAKAERARTDALGREAFG